MRKYIVLFFLLVSTALAGGFLRQSTAVTIPAGPFIDDTDGQTLLASVTVTGISLTITKADGVTVEVAALAASGTANDLVMTTTTTNDCMGYQELQATDLSVVGELTVVWYDADQIYPIKQTYTVLPAASYDALFVTAPGASNGLFIAGTNAATTITSAAGSALTLSSTGGNGNGLVITGNGTGEGISATGGATGNGMELIGGSTSGSGLVAHAPTDGIGLWLYSTTLGPGMQVSGAGGYNGISIAGDGAGAGISAMGGSTGPGVMYSGGGNNASASGMVLSRGGALADDLQLANSDAPTVGAAIVADTTFLSTLASYINRYCMGI